MAFDRLLTELSENLLTEAGDFLVVEYMGAAMVASATVTADLNATITPLASVIAVSNVTEATLTLPKFVAASIAASSSASGTVTTSIRLAAGLSAASTVSAPLSTTIRLGASTSAQSATTAAITATIRLGATLTDVAAASGQLYTKINVLSALIGVSNLTSADLTVNHYDPYFDRLDNAIYLAEIQGYDPGSSGVVTWRFSSGRGFDNSGIFYEPRIEQPALLTRSMGGSSIGGKTNISYGELTLINNDGGLNALADDFFDGRTLTLKRGDPDLGYGSFTTVLVATIESVGMERERVSVRLRDKAITLDTPFSSVKYAGTNVLPAGIEGTADDIKGQNKPRIFGRIALMTPKLVNTSKLIYQVNNGAVDSVVNVFDAGAYLTRGTTDYTSQADMEANAPASGTFRVWPAGGCFRLGSSPYGTVSTCVVEKWDYSQSNASGIIQRILTELGYTSANWVAADFTALNQKNAATLGVVVKDDETTTSLLNRICQSIGAWWGFDSLGRFRVARLDAPSGTAAATITDLEILELERRPIDMLPLWQTTVRSDINYAVQTGTSLAGIVSENRVNWLSLESRDQKASDTTVKSVRLLADDETYDSLLNGISQAQAESTRRLGLFSVRRDTVTLTLANPYNYFSTLDLGAVVNLQTSKLGYSSGKLFTVTGVNIDYGFNTIDLTLWG